MKFSPYYYLYSVYRVIFLPHVCFFAPLHLQNGFSPPKIHSDAVDVLKEIWFETLEFAILNLTADNEGEKDKNKMGIYFPEYSRETSSQKQVSVLLVHCIMFVL